MPDIDDVGIRRYLLGLLPAPEAEALEQVYFAEPEVLERIRSVEHDLLDDYAAGLLDPPERDAFERHYLSTRPLRERVAAARALRLVAPRVARPSFVRLLPALNRWGAPVAI